MVVKFSQESDSGSNKPEKYSVQLTATAYWYDRPTGYRVSVLKPKIDRLSVTFPVQSINHQDAIRKNLQALAKSTQYPELTVWQKLKYWGAGKYKRSYGLTVAPGKQVLVQCMAGHSNTAFFRFDLNPDHIGPEGVAKFRNSIPILSDGHVSYADIANHGRITRIDVAFDLINVDVEDLLVGSKNKGKKLSYFGVGGKIETAYQNTSNTVYVYDKRQKQIDDDAEPEYGSAPHTRVEVRTKPTKHITELTTLNSQPKKVFVVDIEAPEPPEDIHHWKLFQDSCRYRGLDGALNQLSGGIREKYVDAIEAIEGEVWKPDTLWKHWPETVKKSGLLN